MLVLDSQECSIAQIDILLILDELKRTEKVILAVVYGIPIVKLNLIESKIGREPDTDDYLWL